MKKRVLPLLLAALLCLTGCGSFLQREWYEVKDHSPNNYEGNGRDALQADTYQDLVNNILILVGNHTAEGTIWLYYAQEDLDAAVAMERACQEVEHETPVGSYAVEYLQYTVDDSARNYSEIVVTMATAGRSSNWRGSRTLPTRRRCGICWSMRRSRGRRSWWCSSATQIVRRRRSSGSSAVCRTAWMAAAGR